MLDIELVGAGKEAKMFQGRLAGRAPVGRAQGFNQGFQSVHGLAPFASGSLAQQHARGYPETLI